jgi:hypothetical protein
MSAMSSIIFKLKQRASKKSKLEVLRALQTLFHAQAEQAFPDTPAEDLANIFALTVPANKEKQVLRELAGMIAVEYAEPEPKRQLFSAAN